MNRVRLACSLHRSFKFSVYAVALNERLNVEAFSRFFMPEYKRQFITRNSL
jgi:hypothetical protein